MNAEDNVGIDGWVNSYQETSNLQKELEKKQIHLTLAPDPFNELWTDRPALPDNKVFIHELKYAVSVTRIKSLKYEKQSVVTVAQAF